MQSSRQYTSVMSETQSIAPCRPEDTDLIYKHLINFSFEFEFEGNAALISDKWWKKGIE